MSDARDGGTPKGGHTRCRTFAAGLVGDRAARGRTPVAGEVGDGARDGGTSEGGEGMCRNFKLDNVCDRTTGCRATVVDDSGGRATGHRVLEAVVIGD